MKALGELARRRPFALALLFALAVLCIPYRMLLGPGVPSGRDLVPYFYPLKAHLVEALRAGELPWIDRYRWGGLPLVSWPGVAAFDPGNVLFLILPTGAAAKAWMLLRVFTGAAGFAVFLRRTGLGPLSSAIGAVAWGASGITASSASFLSTSSAHAALPWLAAALVHARSERSARSVALLALATALLLVPSLPEPIVAGAAVAIVLVSAGGNPASLRERLGTAGLWGVAGLLGALLAAPVLGALLVTGLESVRGVPGALLPAFAAQGALPPERLADLLADGTVADWTSVSRADGIPGSPYFPSLTPGRVAWTLALLGLVAGRGARSRALAIAGLGVLLALGPATPVAGLLLRAVPFASSIRYPEKYAVLFGFGLAWLAACGAAVLERALPARRAMPAFLALATMMALDRASITPRLVPLDPSPLLDERPAVLSGIRAGEKGAPPPRLFSLNGYRTPPGVATPEAWAAGRAALEWAIPWSPTRHGIGFVLERDYDVSLPRAQLEWVLFLEGSPDGSPVPAALARAAGALGVVDAAHGDDGRPVPRLRLFRDPVPPYRFVERVVAGPDTRALATRFLAEGVPTDAAFVAGAGRALVPSPGRVLGVRDLPSGLELEVEVDGPGPAYLFVARPVVSTRAATVDRLPVAVADANFGFSGLAVPPGRHVVRLRPSGRWLIIATVSSALGFAGIALLFRRGSATAPAAS